MEERITQKTTIFPLDAYGYIIEREVNYDKEDTIIIIFVTIYYRNMGGKL